jgi:altronate dehydratase
MADIKIGSRKLMIKHHKDWMDIPLNVLIGVKPRIKAFGYFIYIKQQDNGK